MTEEQKAKQRIQERMEEFKRRARLKVPISKQLKKKIPGKDVTRVSPTLVRRIKGKLVKFVPTRKDSRVNIDERLTAVAKHLAGKSQREVETEMGLGNGYVNSALKRMFPDKAILEDLLEKLMLNNAVTAGQVFHEKAKDLTPKDAAIAGGIYTQRYIDLKKAKNSGFKETPSTSLILTLESTLAKAEKALGGRVLEADAEIRQLPSPDEIGEEP